MKPIIIVGAFLALALVACHDKRQPIVYPPQPQPSPYVPPYTPAPAPAPAPAPVVVPLPEPPPAPLPEPPAPPPEPPPAPPSPAPGIQPIAVPQCPQTTVGVDGWVVTCGSPATSLLMGGAPGAAVLDIPADGNGVHYVIRANAWGPLAGRTMVMRYSVDGDCQLQAKGDGTYDPGEPMLTLYFQQGPQLSNNEDTRWWGGTARGKLIENGPHEMRLTVAPEGWSNIMGHGGIGREGQFAAAAGGATYVGFTAGGGYFGHGVWCSPGGTKRIVITDYHVE